jgi:tetratricopeptide (TPR) repeat protein
MRLWTVGTVALVAVCAIDGSGRRARAESSILTSEQRTSAAREHFDRGNSYFESHEYDNAIKEFEASYQIKPVPLLLFDIGNVARVAGKSEMAIEYFRRYLKSAPPGTRERIEARRFVGEMTKPGYKPPAPELPPPAAAPPPAVVTPAPAVAPAPVLPPPAPVAEKQPLYKKWWLWTAVGAVAAGAAVGIAVAATTPRDAAIPAGATALQFH